MVSSVSYNRSGVDDLSSVVDSSAPTGSSAASFTEKTVQQQAQEALDLIAVNISGLTKAGAANCLAQLRILQQKGAMGLESTIAQLFTIINEKPILSNLSSTVSTAGPSLPAPRNVRSGQDPGVADVPQLGIVAALQDLEAD